MKAMKRVEDLTRDDILARKKTGRHDLASLSFGKKVLIVEWMREELAPFIAMRTKRREDAAVAARQAPAIPDVTRIKSVAVPTLFVWGRDDRAEDVQTATRFQQDIAGAQLVVIDDASHAVHEEKPESQSPR